MDLISTTVVMIGVSVGGLLMLLFVIFQVENKRCLLIFRNKIDQKGFLRSGLIVNEEHLLLEVRLFFYIIIEVEIKKPLRGS